MESHTANSRASKVVTCDRLFCGIIIGLTMRQRKTDSNMGQTIYVTQNLWRKEEV